MSKFAAMLAVIVSLPIPALAQREAIALEGIWHGYDSSGSRLYLNLTERDDGGIEGSMGLGTGEDVIELPIAFEFHSGSADVTFLIDTATSVALVVRWFGDDGIELSWPDGRIAILARVVEETAEPTTSGVTSAFASAGFATEVQARILSLSGDWYAGDVRYHYTVTDPGVGSFEWSVSRETGTTSQPVQGRITRVSGEAMRLEGGRLLRWISGTEISIEEDGEEVLRLTREARD
jgi:hypothetical protein